MAGLRPLIWPDQPAAFDANGLALLLLELPEGTPRADARRLARQVVREALGKLLALPVERISLLESAQGPLLPGTSPGIRISLSYAGAWVLIGLAEGRALGVDMVRIAAFPEIEALARLYLPAASRRTLRAAPQALRPARFAEHWARLEAACKCLGLPLREIDAEREHALTGCTLLECQPADGYRLAVAVAGGR